MIGSVIGHLHHAGAVTVRRPRGAPIVVRGWMVDVALSEVVAVARRWSRGAPGEGRSRPANAAGHAGGSLDEVGVEHPPRPLEEMTREEMAAWASEDPDRARRYLRYMERQVRQRKRELRKPAIVSSFTGAFLLVSLGSGIYATTHGYALLEPLSGRYLIATGAVLLVVWAVLWVLIASRRRHVDRSG